MDLGRVPLQLGSMRTYKDVHRTAEGQQEAFELIVDLVYNGDAEFALTLAGTSVGISNAQLHGKLVIEVPQILPEPPFVSGVAVYFANSPTVSMSWTGVTKFLDVSLLNRQIQKIVLQQLGNVMVLPNRIAVNMDSQHRSDIFRLKSPRPEGVLRVELVRAENLIVGDVGICGKSSDPYVTFFLGSQEWRSDTVNRSLNPKWQGQIKEFLVDRAAVQHLHLEVWDEDSKLDFSGDDPLGNAIVEISELLNEGDHWLALEDEDGYARQLNSRVLIRTQWFSLTLNCVAANALPHLTRPLPLAEGGGSTCLFFVGIYSALALPFAQAGTSHWVEVHMGDDVKEVKSTKRVAVMDRADAEEARNKVARKIIALHDAGVNHKLIADTVECPLHQVNEYIEEKRSNSKVKRIATHDLRISGGTTDAVFEEGLEFLLDSPYKDVFLNLKRAEDSAEKQLGKPIQFDVASLLKSDTLTETQKLSIPDIDDAVLSVRLQLRVLERKFC